MLRSLFNKIAGLQACNFLKKVTPTHGFSLEYGRIFKNTYLEEHLRTCINLTQLKGSSNKSKFYTSKTYSFSLQQAVKKIDPPNILAVSPAGMFVDRETHNIVLSWSNLFTYFWE